MPDLAVFSRADEPPRWPNGGAARFQASLQAMVAPHYRPDATYPPPSPSIASHPGTSAAADFLDPENSDSASEKAPYCWSDGPVSSPGRLGLSFRRNDQYRDRQANCGSGWPRFEVKYESLSPGGTSRRRWLNCPPAKWPLSSAFSSVSRSLIASPAVVQARMPLRSALDPLAWDGAGNVNLDLSRVPTKMNRSLI